MAGRENNFAYNHEPFLYFDRYKEGTEGRKHMQDPDLGYYGIIGIDSYKHAFKIPTIRNIDKTAPYMHNGVYPTLEQVMEFYDKGGAGGLGIDLPNQTLSEENLQLTEKEKEDIIAFMESLESRF